MRKIQDWPEYINRRLPKNTASRATLVEGFFYDKVILTNEDIKANIQVKVVIELKVVFGDYALKVYEDDQLIADISIKSSGTSNYSELYVMDIIEIYAPTKITENN